MAKYNYMEHPDVGSPIHMTNAITLMWFNHLVHDHGKTPAEAAEALGISQGHIFKIRDNG